MSSELMFVHLTNIEASKPHQVGALRHGRAEQIGRRESAVSRGHEVVYRPGWTRPIGLTTIAEWQPSLPGGAPLPKPHGALPYVVGSQSR